MMPEGLTEIKANSGLAELGNIRPHLDNFPDKTCVVFRLGSVTIISWNYCRHQSKVRVSSNLQLTKTN